MGRTVHRMTDALAVALAALAWGTGSWNVAVGAVTVAVLRRLL